MHIVEERRISSLQEEWKTFCDKKYIKFWDSADQNSRSRKIFGLIEEQKVRYNELWGTSKQLKKILQSDGTIIDDPSSNT